MALYFGAGHWEDFIEAIRANGINDVLAVNEFVKIIDWLWFYNRPIQFTSNELALIKGEKTVNITNSSVPKIMRELFEIVEDVYVKIAQKYEVSKSICGDSSEYGFWIGKKEEKEILFFGVTLAFWEKNHSPLTLSITDNLTYPKEFYELYHDKLFEEDGYYSCIPFPNEQLAKSSVDEIVNFIFEVAKKIDIKEKQ